MKDVLVILPTPRDRQALKEIAGPYRFHWLSDDDFAYPRPQPAFDLVAYTERCSVYVRRHAIQAVLYSHDLANLVAGVLCDRHGLPGPSLESLFLTNHKYYSRTREPDPIWFDYIDLETGEWGKGPPRFPCFDGISPIFRLVWLLSLCFAPWLALLAGFTARRQLKERAGLQKGRRLALAGLVLGGITGIFLIIVGFSILQIVLPALSD